MITRDNLLYSTFIGLTVEIANSSQREIVGLKGTVVDETKNLIVIEIEKGTENKNTTITELKIPKVSSVFRFTLDDGSKMDVNGKDIAFRPHERAKKV